MRYVEKIDSPDFFKNTNMKVWNNFRTKKKDELKRYILDKEQNYLCIYCERKIDLEDSHLEHIKPKTIDKENLSFDYSNISVSCEGLYENSPEEVKDTKKYTCGHRKGRNYDENLFLNPTKIENMSDFFIYDYDDFTILSSELNEEKSKYMIELLNLNYERLLISREKYLVAFQKNLRNIEDIEERKKKIKELLSKKNTEFISFLLFKYKNIT